MGVAVNAYDYCSYAPIAKIQAVVLCPQQVTRTDTLHRERRHGRWQQFGTPCILIKAPQWSHRPLKCALAGRQKPSVKADLTTYTYVIGELQC